jgi:hypothetical protein
VSTDAGEVRREDQCDLRLDADTTRMVSIKAALAMARRALKDALMLVEARALASGGEHYATRSDLRAQDVRILLGREPEDRAPSEIDGSSRTGRADTQPERTKRSDEQPPNSAPPDRCRC